MANPSSQALIGPAPASYPHFLQAGELDPCQSTKPCSSPPPTGLRFLSSGPSLVMPPSALYLCVLLLPMLPTFMELQVILLFAVLLAVSCFGDKRGYKKVFGSALLKLEACDVFASYFY